MGAGAGAKVSDKSKVVEVSLMKTGFTNTNEAEAEVEAEEDDEDAVIRRHMEELLYDEAQPFSPRANQEDNMRESWDNINMSLGLEEDDLLFNMLYFNNDNSSSGSGSGGDGHHHLSLGAILNNALEETVALHSENNTPYKLRPISAGAMAGIEAETLDDESTSKLENPECLVCKDDLIAGSTVVRLQTCKHCFHEDCLKHWLRLQDFCPICRCPVIPINQQKQTSPLNKLNSKAEEEKVNFGDKEEESVIHAVDCHLARTTIVIQMQSKKLGEKDSKVYNDNGVD